MYNKSDIICHLNELGRKICEIFCAYLIVIQNITYKSDILLIIICHFNNREFCCVCSIIVKIVKFVICA